MRMTEAEWRDLVICLLCLGVAACFPWMVGVYWLSIGVSIAMFTVLSTSWAIFSGPTHFISLATAAFFGVGAYVVGIGIDYLPYYVLLPIAAVLGGLLAFLVGLATLRLSGVYFVIFTLGLAEFLRQMITWVQNISGTKGMYVLTSITEEHIYWQLLALAAGVWFSGWMIGRMRLGFALRIIGDDETVAKHVGINTSRAKVLLFMLPGSVAALAGAIIAPRYVYIEPSIAFTPMLSFQVVIMALLGGTGRLWGPLVGVIPFTLLWEVISISAPNQTTLLLGVSFLVIVYFLPKGFVGLVASIKRHSSIRGAQ